MATLDQRRIKFVRNLPIEIRARVLYEFLNKGTSNRNIEKAVDILNEEDGWQAWSVNHFYGFDARHKAKFPTLTIKKLKEKLIEFDDNDLEELHLGSTAQTVSPNITMNENDGKDIFRQIKTRQGQYKLRKKILKNYQSNCALCKISHPNLLITSHIKPWAESTQVERVDSHNCILLCKIHDALFENGFISFTDDFQVLYSTNFDFDSQGIHKNLTFREPIEYLPSPLFLKEHRQKHGYE
ncbi:HNH endonuclease [Bacillus sp. BRMEA1]|nr:HNH endonuclease [Neobacillus endophyticus]